eukprot:TRINITY_DN10840_c0_g6_i1.p1 TRINITY_DN10840_c0_g6~~TRINITY_DN10840_c0_g6_i1.p1  ORF type:complete len:197 (+),score=36.76 TRINITY_DN10840_c0_g6_i1:105-695(+)
MRNREGCAAAEAQSVDPNLLDHEGGRMSTVAYLEEVVEEYHESWKSWFRILCVLVALLHVLYALGPWMTNYYGAENLPTVFVPFTAHPLAVSAPWTLARALPLEGAFACLLPILLLRRRGLVTGKLALVMSLSHFMLWGIVANDFGNGARGPVMAPAVLAPGIWGMAFYLGQTMIADELGLDEVRSLADPNHIKGS